MSKITNFSGAVQYCNPAMIGSIYSVKLVDPDSERRWAIQRRLPSETVWKSTGPARWKTQDAAQEVLDRLARENGWIAIS